MCNFNDIKTRNEFADFLGFSRSKLAYILYIKKPDNYYEIFEIPKKDGSGRKICAPVADLKILQAKLYHALWEYMKHLHRSLKTRTNISHAFEKKKSIITNAKIHRNKRFVLNIDLKDFFYSFHFGRVQGYFEKNKSFLLPREVSIIIAQIACCNGKLPQGAPSSPIITNLICQILDMRLLKTAKKYKLDYTRYADDLTFSTNNSSFFDNYEKFIRDVKVIISKSGFSINDKKTRLLYKDSRQEVTGLVVNKKININRTYIRVTKAMAHKLYTTGAFTINDIPANVNQLEGRFSFIHQIDAYNNGLNDSKHNAHRLNGRELQYRAFMFYKNFYANEFPLIVTEGKTDIRYLKAALMKYYKKYPSLIEKDDEDNFRFKIKFFKRSKIWIDFFGISLDGADAMKVLYRYFTGKNNVKNYFSYFQKICNHEQKSPVVLLFDNETNSKRPLKAFLDENKQITEIQRTELKETLHFQLLPDSKLFLLTNPLVDKKEECEIEDLFSSELLGLVLGGKTFSKKDKFDETQYYGKKVFSEYVFKNYQVIDFACFIPLLDTLNNIVTNNKPSTDI